MKKKMKKILSIVSAAVMTLAMATTAFAGNGQIKVTTSETTERTFKAYQIVTGNYNSVTKTLSDVAWGSAISTATQNNTTFQNAVKTAVGAATFSAEAIIEKLTDSNVETFVNVLTTKAGGSYSYIGSPISLTGTLSSGVYSYETVATLDDGYYIVVDETASIPSGSAAAKTIVKVVGGEVIVPIAEKTSYPTLEKKIVDKEGATSGVEMDTNTASIGDTVTYHLNAKIPENMSQYNRYQYVMHDTLSSGLTFESISSVKVYSIVGGAKQYYKNGGTTAFDYTNKTQLRTATTTPAIADDDTFDLVFVDFKDNFERFSIDGTTQYYIEVEYTATVNENAVIGIGDNAAGNPNTAKLQYSNNPNVTVSSDDMPGDNDVTGVTPDDTVETYVTGITLYKYDTSTGLPMKDVKFTLKGTNLNKVNVIKQTSFTEDGDGTYYLLSNGTYTTTAPNETTYKKYEETKNEASYDSSHAYKKYKPTKTTTLTTATDSVTKTLTATTDESGKVIFEGLEAGDYTLEETTPAGYNSIGAINFKITATMGSDASAKILNNKSIVINGATNLTKWTYTQTSSVSAASFDENVVTIANKPGSSLPETGGIGTRIFYIVGGSLMFVALILLIAKKRMKKLS